MKRYVTTAIDYVNSLPHIGTAYEKIGADVLCRFWRFCGDEVTFHMGNDEHSANVQKAARAQGVSPKEYCDAIRPRFEEVWRRLEIAYDRFIQTSEQRHHESVKAFFKRVHTAGDIYQKDYEGWYCEGCEAFYTEKDLEGGVCPTHKAKPSWIKEKNYFFRLSKYRDFLIKHIAGHPEFILPEKRRNEVVSFLDRQELQDLSISRSTFDWGIPLPLDPKHVMYVWFDALINYVTGAGFGSDPAGFARLWPADVHVVGKDITRFHCVIWPAMLKSAGLPLPRTVLGHGFVYLRGEKMSKTLGNVVTPLDILDRHPEFGADALRYTLLRGSAFGDDSDFTWDDFILRYNSDLANGIGNLASRTLGMIRRYRDGSVVPCMLCAEELALLTRAGAVFKEVRKDLDPAVAGDLNAHAAIEKVWAYITELDRYIDRSRPWALAKDPARANELSRVLYALTEALRLVCLLIQPFIPGAAKRIWEAYGFEACTPLDKTRAADFERVPFLTSPHRLKAENLSVFPRIVDEPASKPSETASKPPVPASSTAPAGVFVGIEDFARLDLRTAKVLVAEKVAGADKLLRLELDLGAEKRQIIAGIARHYAPDALVGRNIVIVANLKPAKIRGVESRGMLLAAKSGETLTLVTTDADIAPGAKVG